MKLVLLKIIRFFLLLPILVFVIPITIIAIPFVILYALFDLEN